MLWCSGVSAVSYTMILHTAQQKRNTSGKNIRTPQENYSVRSSMAFVYSAQLYWLMYSPR